MQFTPPSKARWAASTATPKAEPRDCISSPQSFYCLKPRAVLRSIAPRLTSFSNKNFLLTAFCRRAATMAAPFDPIQAAFKDAMRGFQDELKDDEVYNDILQITTIDQVYDATDKIQKEQAKQGHLRHLAKIEPYLNRLNEYAASIEVFIQVKADVLALIWGPIKLLLQWTSALKNSFDAIVNTMAEISELLPEFKRVASLFDQNAAIKDVMALFFRDILDFYLVALKFFKLPRLKYLFDSLWPRHRDKITVVMAHIENHARLMRNEVRLEHIQQEHEARRRALEHFEKEDRSRRAQEFYRIKTDIAPQLHDDKFDRLQAHVCQGTGTWLLQDTTFKEWLHAAAESSRVMWLQGIPGAGKTYLASTVIAEVQSLGRTAFAFLSYKENRNATAISILHSLIFRVVSGEDDLETVVCQSCKEESKRSLQGATELLTTVLACAGPVYLIVDGLDEIDEGERGRLITQLLLILKSSHGVRLFISSRAEADLISILRNDATVLRVDQRNSECIKTFVERWARHWLVEREFLQEEQTEIEAGLAPLAAKSQGMFLYARVVLNSIKFLDSFEDIREELYVLPETLHDAYGRILKRINRLDNRTVKEKARAILGWVACSPTPLTVQEVQQALSIDLKNPGNLGIIRGNLDIARICGPIVEVVDDYIQFVHFTVKEYLFSSQISGFIDINLATLDLALRCATYLCQAHHDLRLDDNEVCHNILTGVYVLDWFATNMWPQLMKNYLNVTRQDEPHPELISHLERLYDLRQNQSMEDDDIDGLLPDLDTFREVHPESYALLGQSLLFRQICTASQHCMQRGAPWINLDPLTTSKVSVRVHEAIEKLLGQSQEMGESHTKMQRWYGQRPYKCKYLHCEFSRIGFQLASQRKTHEKHHDRPWKCSFSGCEYAEGGFLSRKMRDDHLNRAHSNQNKQAIDVGHASDYDETKLLLLDLTKAGLVDGVQDILSSTKIRDLILSGTNYRGWIGGHTKAQEWVEDMCQAAVLSGSLPMVELCIAKLDSKSDTWSSVTALAIRTGSAEIFEYSLNRCPNLRISGKWWKEMVLHGDHEMLEIWTKFSKNRAWNTHNFRLSSYNYLKRTLMRSEVVRATANDRPKEEVLIRLWRSTQLERRDLGYILIAVASTTCSITLAEYVLEAGAEVDCRRGPKHSTPLHYAARQETAEAADFMKFLLFRGADPDPRGFEVNRNTIFKKNIRDEKGPQGISRWLDITWDELVKKTRGLKHQDS
ncbi:NACHT domain protein [Biscogniauxia sp. FL1348]|nr:NACHT domain protein [Biscogniauxia sp. FL1348]